MKMKQRPPKQEDTYTTHMIQAKDEHLSSGTTSSDYEKKQRPPRQEAVSLPPIHPPASQAMASHQNKQLSGLLYSFN